MLLRWVIAAALALPLVAGATSTINLALSPATIYPGDPVALNVLITNSAQTPLTAAAVSLALPANVTLSSATASSNTCGFNASALAAGGSSVVLTGGTIPAAVNVGTTGTCEFVIALAATVPNSYGATIPANGPTLVSPNTFTPGGSNAGYSAVETGTTVSNSTPATATLVVQSLTAPTGSLSFNPTTVLVGDSTQLSVVLTNNNASADLPLTQFSHALPLGFVVAGTPGAAVSCTGTGFVLGTLSTPTAAGVVTSGDSTITLTGGTIAKSGTCTLRVNVTAPNTSGSVTSTVAANAIGNARGLASASFGGNVTVSNPLTITQAFSVSTTVGDVATLKITLANASTQNSLNVISFTDTLGANLVLQAGVTPALSCTGTGATGATLTAVAGTNSITLTNAALGTVSPRQCVITVGVVATATGSLTSTVTTTAPASQISTAGANPIALTVPASSQSTTFTSPLTISQAFTGSTIAGEVATLKITVANASGVNPLTITALTDVLSAGLLLDASVTPTVVCSGTGAVNGSITATAGTGNITISGAVAGTTASKNCVITVGVTASAANSYTSAVTATSPSSQVSTGGTVPVSLVVPNSSQGVTFTSPLTISQAFTGSTIAGEVAILKITVANASSLNTLNITSLTDVLSAGLLLDASQTPTVVCSGTGAVNGSITATPGTRTITLTGAVAGTSSLRNCVITVGVVSSATGTFTSDITTASPSSQIITGGATPATLTIPASSGSVTFTSPLTINQATNPASGTNIRLGGVATLTLTIANTSTANGMSIASFTDTLASGLTLDASVTPTVVCTGGVNGTLTAVAGSASLSLVNAVAAKSGNCVVTVGVVATVAGTYNMTGATSSPAAQISTASSTPVALVVPASGTSVTYLGGVVLTKSGPSTGYQGQSIAYTVTVSNWTAGAITGVNFTDTMPSGTNVVGPQMTLDTGSALGAGCSGGTFNAALDATALTWTGGTVAAASPLTSTAPSTCTITVAAVVPALAPVGARYTNSLPANTAFTGTTDTSAAVSNLVTVSAPRLTTAASLTVTQANLSPASIVQGNTSVLTITITNPTALPLTGTLFTDNLPANVTVASVPNASSTCPGTTINALPRASTFDVSTMTVPANGGTCSVSVTLTSSVVSSGGGWSMTLPALAIQNNEGVSNSQAAGPKSLVVTTGLGATAAFSPASTGLGGISRLSINVTNNSPIALSALQITNPLPTGSNALVVADAPNISTTCAGNPVLTAVPGSTSASMTGATLATGANCYVYVDIKTTASNANTWTNSLPIGNISSAEGLSNTAAVTATLTKVAAVSIGINKSFAPISIVGGAPSTLRIDLTNPNGASSVVNAVSFTDAFPSGMEVYSVPNANTNCTNGTITAVPGAGQFSVSGVDIAIGATCAVFVDVTSVKSLNLTNTIAAGAIGTQQGFSNTLQTQATLSTLQGINLEKSFSPTAVAPGQKATLTVRIISTLNTTNLTSVAVSDNLPTSPAAMVVATPPNISSTCNTAPTATAGSSTVSIAGVTLAPQSSCTFSVDVTVPSVGTYVNQLPIGAATSLETFSNQSVATASLNALTAPTVGLAFATSPVKAGVSSVLTITLRIPAPSPSSLTSVSMQNTLPAGLTVAATPGASNTCGAVFAPVAGSSTLSLTGGTIPAGDVACTLQVSVVSNTPGAYTPSVGIGALVTAQGISNAAAASATLTVLQFPTVGVAFNPVSVAPNAAGQLSISLGNSNATAITLSSALTITLPTSPSALLIVAPNGLSTTCTGTVTAVAGAGQLSFSSGGTIPAGGCTIHVNVTAAVSGTYTQNIPAGSLQTSAGNQQSNASAALAVSNSAPPTATDLVVSINNDAAVALTIGVLSATPQAPATISSYSIVTVPSSKALVYCNAVLVSAANLPSPCLATQITVVPVGAPSGFTTFTYIATDSGNLSSVPATVTVNFNTPPTATAVTNAAINSSATSAQVLSPMAGTATTAGATLTTYTVVTLPASGSLYCNAVVISTVPTACAFNALGFIPASATPNPVTFTYTVTDSNGMVSTVATFSIPLNLPPAATAINPGLNNNLVSPVAIGPLAGTPQGSATISSYTITSLPGAKLALYCNGTLISTVPTNCASNQLSALPLAAPTGSANFSYTVTDSNGLVSPVAAVTVSFNTPPTATAVTNAAINNNAGTVQALAAMAGTATTAGATLTTYTVVTLPASGSLYCNAVVISTVPTACAFNALGFKPSSATPNPVTFTYTVTDSNSMVSTAAVFSIPLNALPTATAINANLNNNLVTAVALGPLAGTAQVSATIVSYTLTSLPGAKLALYCNGTLVSTVPANCAGNQVTALPLLAPTGSANFSYTVTDSNGMVSLAATVTVNFNTPPTATTGLFALLDPAVAGSQAMPTLSGTVTTPGATLQSYTVTRLPLSGLLNCSGTPISVVPTACAATGLGFTPAAITSAILDFQFTVTDSNGQVSQPATVTITVEASPALTIVKTSGGAMTVGFDGRYTLQVSNAAPLMPTSGVVTVVDVLPAGLDLVSASGSSTPSAWTCVWTLATRTVSCTSPVVIAANSSAEPIVLVVRPTALAVSTGTSADIPNTATVSGGGELPGYANGSSPGSKPHSSTATQTVSLAAVVSGSSWVDLNHNGARDPGEPLPAPDTVRVEVWPAGTTAAQAASGTPLKSALVDAAGNYTLTAPVGSVQIRFINVLTQSTLGLPVNGETPASRNQAASTGSNGVVANGVIDNITLAAGATLTQQSLPIDPQGVVYDSGTRLPIGGASVTLLVGGVPVPVGCLAGGANPFVTAASGGAAGLYQFLLDFAAAGCSALSGRSFDLNVVASGYSAPSQVLPVSAGSFTAPAGSGNFAVVAKATAPAAADPTTHYLTVVLSSTSKGVVNNHLPLDGAATAGLALSKTANKATAEIGDTVRYTIVLRNTGKGTSGSTTLTDRLPLGFKYMQNTAVLTVNGTAQLLTPLSVGTVLTFPFPSLVPGASASLQYLVRLGVGADRGDGINRVTAQAGSLFSNDASARVKVSGGVFGTDACVVGTVFMDCNGNALQDKGERGVAGVRLFMETGLSITSDVDGKFSYCGLAPQTHAIRLDPKTLPAGTHPLLTSSRNLGDPASLVLDVKNGELIRADFALGQCSDAAQAVPPAGPGPGAPPVKGIFFESPAPAKTGEQK